jgi:hypothetical protein
MRRFRSHPHATTAEAPGLLLRKSHASLSYTETGEGAFCRRYTPTRQTIAGVIRIEGKMLHPCGPGLVGGKRKR